MTIELTTVQGLLGAWWCAYDEGDFDAWPAFFTPDTHFSCRSDSGETAFEEFLRADVRGRDDVVAWQAAHRRNSPYPLRHMAANVHLTAARPGEVDFRSYLFVTHVVEGAVVNLSTGVVVGTVRADGADDAHGGGRGGTPRFADLRLVLDFTDSVTFTDATRREPA
jgi:hypothetical protein